MFFGYMRLYFEGRRQKNKIIYREIELELGQASREWRSGATPTND
jgi:hypothetical protein